MFVAGCGDQWFVEGDDVHPNEASQPEGTPDTNGGISSAVVGLSVTPGVMTIDIAATATVVAIGRLESGDVKNVTSRVTWTSSASGVATIAGGVVTPHAVGTATLTAAMEGLSASATITITQSTATVVALTVSADNSTLPVGESMAYHATASMSDGVQRDVTAMATWSVSPSSIASISAAGVAHGDFVGAGTVTAQWSGQTGSVPLIVTLAQLVRIEVEPAAFSLGVGFTRTATATAVYSDGSTLDVTALAQWAATPTSVATVLPLGIVSAHAVGSASLTASLGGRTGTAAVTVTAATLVSIEISPSVISIAVGGDLQLTALGLFSDGSRVDMTTQVMWTSAALGVAMVSSTGKVSSSSAGVAAITASFGAKSATVLAVITAASLTAIQVPGTLTIPVGRWADVLPIGVFSDGLTQLLGSGVSFSSSDNSVASVSASGRITANGPGEVTITVTTGLVSASIHVIVTPALLQTVVVTPVVVVVTSGATMQMSASATYSDGTVVDVTAQGAWSTGSPSVASVSNAAATKGKVTGVTVGVTTVSVLVDGVTASAAVTVSPAILDGLIVTPPLAVLPRGFEAALVAVGHYSDDSTLDLTGQVTWTSSNPTIVTVANSTGMFGHIVAKAPGMATITATKGAVSKSVPVTVTAAILDHIELPSLPITIPRGLTVPVVALGVYSDGSHVDISTSVDWTSSAPAIASVSNLAGAVGVVTGNAVGDAIITASHGGKSATIPVHVTAALLQSIQLPSAMTVPRGLTLPVIATGMYSDGSSVDITSSVTWSSSAPAIASVSNLLLTVGLVTGNAVGDATLTATYQGKTATVPVHVTSAILQGITLPAATMTVPRGLTLPIIATGVYSDGSVADLTSSVTWSSNAPGAASVSSLILSAGLVTGVTQGTATITATINGKTATTTVQVTASILGSLQLPTSPLTVPRGLTLPVIATGVYSDGSIADLTGSVDWTSSAPAIASVSNVVGAVGIVTGNSVGDATLTASMGGKTATVTVHVTAAVLSSIQVPQTTMTVPRGLTLPIVATGIYSDGSIATLTSNVTWTSSAPAIATVSNLVASAGLVTGVAQGTTTVTATLGAQSATTTVQVTSAVLSAIQLPTSTVSVPKGLTVPVIATGVYSDGSLVDITSSVTWTSNAPAIATVSSVLGSVGVVTGKAVGDTTITATLDGTAQTVPVHVTAAILQGLSLPQVAMTVPRGLTLPIVATGIYSDGSLVDLTSSVTWTSSAPSVATVSGLLASAGLVTGVTQGAATITASLSGSTATTNVTVTAAILSALQLPATTLNVPRGLTLPVVATGVYSDGSLADLTSTVAWSSSAPSIASVSNVVGSVGLVTGVTAGDATLTATYGGKSATVPVHVTAAILSGIQLPTGTLMVTKGLFTPIVATGVYSDGSLATITSSVTWSSSAPAIATVSNIIGSAGLVTGVQTGFATITATLGAAAQTVQVQVTPAILQGLTVNIPTTLGLLQTGVATVTGTFSDGTTADVTSQVSFSSSNPLAATVTSLGSVLGLALGTTTIAATLGSVTGSTAVGIGGGDGCHLVVNEIKAGTLLKAKDDFIEIYNPCSFAVDSSQVTLVYREAVDTTDETLAALTGSIPAGGYRIFVGAQYTSGGTVDGTFATDLGGLLGGGVGLRMNGSGTLIDSVAWGVSVNGLNEGVLLGAITLGSSLARLPNGKDTNANVVDFALLTTATPRAAN